ncbi:MAG: CGGC domain-containing protein [Archaeoglobus sp.]|nr:CGGC domain-containing protein [Archaeoglobus sp.]
MTRIAILCCESIRDKSCIACAKCFKGIKEKNGTFEKIEDEIELVGIIGCGGCPGLVVPKMKLFKTCLDSLDMDFDKLFVGTCVKTAIDTGNCPIEDYGLLKNMLEEKFGKEVIIGTHTW